MAESLRGKALSDANKMEKAGVALRRKRSRLASNPLIILVNFVFILLVFVAFVSASFLYFAGQMLVSPGPLSENRNIMIAPGSGIRQISAQLEAQGFINNATIFAYAAHWQGKARTLKAGEYEVAAHSSIADILDILTQGRSIEYAFTVPEGLTVQQIFDRLAANEVLIGDLPQNLPPEGWLMTDTVYFTRGTTRRAIVERLVRGQEKRIEEIWKNRAADLPLVDVNQFVTLASIVEKETGVASERPHVASVFYNRLARNMRLQSDPTVIYGIFGSAGKPSERPIYRSDLDKETPFNTYKINGLPPSPIANPGRAALEAVAHPPKTDDLYFVADGTGGHVFAKTLEEHNRNVRAWRAVERERASGTNN